MRIPLSWLRELVEVDVGAEVLAERLSVSGISVESVDRLGGNVSGVVVAEIRGVSEVPGSDKLVSVDVDAGPSGSYHVVAGARNFGVGDHVPFARPGATVTTIEGAIGVRTMPGGVESQGMLCSARELGVSEDHGGILVLGPDAPVGADVSELLGLGDDVLELEITPNRPDLLSVFGVAREVSVLFEVPLRPEAASHVADGPDVAGLTSVTVEAPEGCPRYLAMVVEGVVFDASPIAVQRRLHACGMRPLGNLVDAANYVLLLTGQPLHAFDLDRLHEQRIVVRWAEEGERMVTLDGVERELTRSDLVIADGAHPQALAGVMGGAASEVSPSTTRILLESAYFHPQTIGRTARRLGIQTEASRRFERGSDPGAVPGAAALCAELLRLWAGGTVARGEIDFNEVPARRTIRLRGARTDALMGVEVPPATTQRMLAGLGCDLVVHDDHLDVVPPTWRPDLTREIDLVEEVARLYGYDRVPLRVPTGVRGFLTPDQLLRRRLREVLLGAGLSEVTLSSFLSDADVAAAGLQDGFLCVSNPLSVEQQVLRPSLIPNLLRAAQRNASRELRETAVFELGHVFGPWQDAEADLPTETLRLGVLMAGAADVLDVKGVVEVLLRELGVRVWSTGPCAEPSYHPGRSATLVVEGSPAGTFGTLRPSVARAFDLEGTPVVAELDVATLLQATPTELVVADIPRLPPVRRDITVEVSEDVPAGEVEAVIRSAAGPHTEEVFLRDLYRGEQVAPGHKALTFRVVLRASDRTLTDAEADAARDAVVAAVTERLGARVR